MPKRSRDEKYTLPRSFPAARIAVFRSDGNNIVLITKEIDALFDALVIGNADAFSSLTKEEANYKDSRGHSLLARAIELGDHDIVEALIIRGADINWADENGNTILHIAVEEGNLNIINTLLCYGASNLTQINSDEVSVLDLAIISANPYIISQLMHIDPNLIIQRFSDAVETYNSETLNLLLTVDALDFTSQLQRLFEYAVLDSNSERLIFLLELENNGINLNHRCFTKSNTLPFKLTPIQLVFYSLDNAHSAGDVERENILIEILKLLIHHGADVLLINDKIWMNKIKDLERHKNSYTAFLVKYTLADITDEEYSGIRNLNGDELIKLLNSPNYVNFFKVNNINCGSHYHTQSEIILYYKIIEYQRSISGGALSLDEDFDFFTFENEELLFKLENMANSYVTRGWRNEDGDLLFIEDISKGFGVEYFANIIYGQELLLARKILISLFNVSINYLKREAKSYAFFPLIKINQNEYNSVINKILQLMDVDYLNKIGILGIVCNSRWSEKEKFTLVKLLLERGVDIDGGDATDDYVPLLVQVKSNLKMIEFFIEHGANVNVLYKGKNIFEILMESSCHVGNAKFKSYVGKYNHIFKNMIFNGMRLQYYGCDKNAAKSYKKWIKINEHYKELKLAVESEMNSFYNSVGPMDKTSEISDKVNRIFNPFISQLEMLFNSGKRKLPGMEYAFSKYYSFEEMDKFSSMFPLINKASYKLTGGKLRSEIFIERGLMAEDVPGDGNCFFHAVARQLKLLNDGEEVMNYQVLRELAVNQVIANIGQFQDFTVEETIDEYIDRISQEGEWADNPLIEALVREIGVNIVIINNAHIDQPHVISGGAHQGNTIYIGHIGETHYVSLEETLSNGNAERFQALQAQVQIILAQRAQEELEQQELNNSVKESDSDDSTEEEELDASVKESNSEENDLDSVSKESDSDGHMEDEELDDSTDYYTEDDLDSSSEDDEISLDNPIQVVDFDHSSPLTAAVGVVLLGIQTSNTHHD